MKHRVPNRSRGMKRHVWERIGQGELARQLLFRNRGARFLEYLGHLAAYAKTEEEKRMLAA